MFVSRVSSRLPRSLVAQCRNSLLLLRARHNHSPITSKQFHSMRDSQNKVVTGQVSLLHYSILNPYAFQQFGFSSSASPQSGNERESTVDNNGTAEKASGYAKVVDQEEISGSKETEVADEKEESGSSLESESNTSQSVKRRKRGTKRTAFSDSDSEGDLTMDDLVKLVTEKEELLKVKHKEIEKMQDKVLRSYADMENVMERTRREAENSKKFAIQNFAKSLLDVADNLGRASSVVKESFAKIDTSKDTSAAVPLLKTLLEGVEMTEKQLIEVFKKFGVEKYDPTDEQFDPHRHNAVFQLSDASKPPGTVAIVLKSGYTLHDRVIRPAEVGVTEASESNEADKGSET